MTFASPSDILNVIGPKSYRNEYMKDEKFSQQMKNKCTLTI